MKKNVFKNIVICLVMVLIFPSLFVFSSCKSEKMIKLYNTETKDIETISLEKYIEGVVAGEVDNTYPLEALKAQAVLARTFTLKFLKDEKSKYEGADISTDISEAQAYNPKNINENITRAVKETKGKTVKYNGEYINAWFFSNAGGKTATAKEGLTLGEDFDYIKSVETKESSENTKNYSFSVLIEKDKILAALRNMGVSITNIKSFKIGEKGESARALTFIVGDKEVNANTFRMNIGSSLLKSTLIDEISVSEGGVTFVGRGYGHGVGLSQEYSKVLAEDGLSYKEIINFFFEGVTI